MARTLSHSLRAILLAFAGFTVWVIADTCMKLAGEAALPPYEVVGFMGLFASLYMIVWRVPLGCARDLWPKKPGQQVVRALLSFGCAMANALALKHLPLTLFYVIVFTCPMVIAMLAARMLHERLTKGEIAAIIVGFAGVAIAVRPWGDLGGGDWIGYAAVTGSVLFFSFSTIVTRVTTQTESYAALAFFTAATEAVLGLGLTWWHGVPVDMRLLLILGVLGAFNVSGNILNYAALRYASAAVVEQYHYTQIIMGALLGYLIWGEVPTAAVLAGAALITASGLYIAVAMHKAAQQKAIEEI